MNILVRFLNLTEVCVCHSYFSGSQSSNPSKVPKHRDKGGKVPRGPSVSEMSDPEVSVLPSQSCCSCPCGHGPPPMG